MKRKIRHILHLIKSFLLYGNRIIPWLYIQLCNLKLLQPYIIIYVDGGICSQMHQYLLGRYYVEKGMHVAYDLGWYSRNGMDNNRVFERRFEFTEMWPDLPFKVASGEMVTFYSRVFQVKRNGMHFPLDVMPPKYFGGYYFFDDNTEYGRFFMNTFSLYKSTHPVKVELIDDWIGTRCAVHVRRGDLARMDDCFYGKVTIEYFKSALDYMKSRFNEVKFFFFSDELDWVEQNIIQYVGNDEYELMKGNKAWEDLALMAHCDCFISSQGSAGKVAALMNGKGLLIIPNDPHDLSWEERYGNVLVIDT